MALRERRKRESGEREREKCTGERENERENERERWEVQRGLYIICNDTGVKAAIS